MAQREFQMALAQLPTEPTPEQEAETVVFVLGDQKLEARVPTDTEILVFQMGSGVAPGRALWQLAANLFGLENFQKLRDLVAKGVLTEGMLYGGDDNNESGILDKLVELRVARPTQAPIASSPSSQSDGQRSMGRSPGVGSTASETYPSEDFSTSSTDAF